MQTLSAVITGGAGFIGSRLAHALVGIGADVTVLDDLSGGKRENLPPEARFLPLDVAALETKERLAELAPDVVFHLAAQADVQRSIENPSADCRTNVLGTLQVLEALRQTGKGKIVFASTSAVYGMLQKERIREDDAVNPVSFYGQSKLTAEQYIRLYHSLFGTRYTILRYGNVFGPGQTPKGEGGVVAVYLEKLRKREPLVLFGDGEQTRDFIFVDDVVAANLAAAEKGDGETLNVSRSATTRIRELAETLLRLSGITVPIVRAAAKPGDILHSCLDNGKLVKALNTQPVYSVEQGLTETLRSAGLLGKV
ncbi:NAD-dependent epimerase/dehydratase family protein [Gorillibacterium sp. sgz500922]|uniref:NAD-dependent epimerase/dehydratase family protein n=1 Tax=Gorillibacterium sp. sgz500922 TaxID=3446694 RepID=UPI003F670B0F